MQKKPVKKLHLNRESLGISLTTPELELPWGGVKPTHELICSVRSCWA
jgi:hypothetical protein